MHNKNASIQGQSLLETVRSRCCLAVSRPQRWSLEQFRFFLSERLKILCLQIGVACPVITEVVEPSELCKNSPTLLLVCNDTPSCVRLCAIKHISIPNAWVSEDMRSGLTNFCGQPLLEIIPYVKGECIGGIEMGPQNSYCIALPSCVAVSRMQLKQALCREREGVPVYTGPNAAGTKMFDRIWRGAADPGAKVYSMDLGDGCVWPALHRVQGSQNDYLKVRLVVQIDNKPLRWDQGSLFRYLRDYYYMKFATEGLPPPIIADVLCYDNSKTAFVAFRDEYSAMRALSYPFIETGYTGFYATTNPFITLKPYVPASMKSYVLESEKILEEQCSTVGLVTGYGTTGGEGATTWQVGIRTFATSYLGGLVPRTGAFDGTSIGSQIVDRPVRPVYWPAGLDWEAASTTLRERLGVVCGRIPSFWTVELFWEKFRYICLLENDMGLCAPHVLSVKLNTPAPEQAVIICADEASRNLLLKLRVLYIHGDWKMAVPNLLLYKYNKTVEAGDINRAALFREEMSRYPEYILFSAYEADTEEWQRQIDMKEKLNAKLTREIMEILDTRFLAGISLKPHLYGSGLIVKPSFFDNKGVITGIVYKMMAKYCEKENILFHSVDSMDWRKCWPMNTTINEILTIQANLEHDISGITPEYISAAIELYNNTENERFEKYNTIKQRLKNVYGDISDNVTFIGDHDKEFVSQAHVDPPLMGLEPINSDMQGDEGLDVYIPLSSLIDSMILLNGIYMMKETNLVLVRQVPAQWLPQSVIIYIKAFLHSMRLPIPNIVDGATLTKNSVILAMKTIRDALLLKSIRQIGLPATEGRASRFLDKNKLSFHSWLEPSKSNVIETMKIGIPGGKPTYVGLSAYEKYVSSLSIQPFTMPVIDTLPPGELDDTEQAYIDKMITAYKAQQTMTGTNSGIYPQSVNTKMAGLAATTSHSNNANVAGMGGLATNNVACMAQQMYTQTAQWGGSVHVGTGVVAVNGLADPPLIQPPSQPSNAPLPPSNPKNRVYEFVNSVIKNTEASIDKVLIPSSVDSTPAAKREKEG